MQVPLQVILNEAVANGVGTPINVGMFNTVMLQVGSTNSGACVLKVQGSISNDVPAFGTAASVTNHWDYVETYDLMSATELVGDTGLTFSGTDANNIRNLMVNVANLKWINVEVSGYSAGKVTVKAAVHQ